MMCVIIAISSLFYFMFLALFIIKKRLIFLFLFPFVYAQIPLFCYLCFNSAMSILGFMSLFSFPLLPLPIFLVLLFLLHYNIFHCSPCSYCPPYDHYDLLLQELTSTPLPLSFCTEIIWLISLLLLL